MKTKEKIEAYLKELGINPQEKIDNSNDGYWRLTDLIQNYMEEQPPVNNSVVLDGVVCSFVEKCNTKNVKTGEHCPEEPTRYLHKELICDKCYNNWVDEML